MGSHISHKYIVSLCGVFFTAITLLLSSCGSLKQLQEFQERHQSGDFQWIVSQPVDCESDTRGCNELHLIKGDACLVSATKATTEQEKKEFYSCAAEELETGLRLTDRWKFGELYLGWEQIYENLCQALLNLQDMQSGDEASATATRLLSAAEQFKQFAPDNFAASYYLYKARFRELLPELITANETSSERLCNELATILADVEIDIARGQTSTNRLWERYENNFRTLRQLIVTEKEMLAGCDDIIAGGDIIYIFEKKNGQTYLSLFWKMKFMENCDSLAWEILSGSQIIASGKRLLISDPDIRLEIPLQDDFPEGIYDAWFRCYQDGRDHDRTSISFKKSAGVWER